MPEVSIIDYTGKGSRDESWHAARLLAFTKNTRLQMNPDGFKEFEDMPVQSIAEEIAYMATTIPSSWEFVDVTFLMTDLSRATAQQVTRTRTASFAMQSQRVTEMSGVTWDTLWV
jgi:thymidylate synthase ThyX